MNAKEPMRSQAQGWGQQMKTVGLRTFMRIEDNFGNLIAYVAGGDSINKMEERARLLAAAPELLGALISIVESFGSDEAFDEAIALGIDGHIVQARDAIAKATMVNYESKGIDGGKP